MNQENDDMLARFYASIPKRLDVETLRSIPDEDLLMKLNDFIFVRVRKDASQEYELVGQLSPGLRALYLTMTVDGEINNGGWNQYYYNTQGVFASDAVAAFEYFGAAEHAALMREANEVRAAEESDMARFDDGTIESFSKSYEVTRLGPLDERYMSLGDDLSKLHIAKIRDFPEQFTGE